MIREPEHRAIPARLAHKVIQGRKAILALGYRVILGHRVILALAVESRAIPASLVTLERPALKATRALAFKVIPERQGQSAQPE